MRKLYFRCIKSLADEDNIILMRNDILEFIQQEEDGKGVILNGVYGWSKDHELSFTNEEMALHFEMIYPYYGDDSPYKVFSSGDFRIF